MDRNTIIGFVLIFILVIVYSLYNQDQVEKENERQKIVQDSLARIEDARILDSIRTARITDTTQIETPAEEIPVEIDSVRQTRYTEQYGPFADAVTGETETFTLENEQIKVEFSSRGGKVNSVQIKGYKTFHQDSLYLFKDGDMEFGLGLPVGNNFIRTDSLYFQGNKSGNTVTFKIDVGEGRVLEQVYSLEPESNWVNYKINLIGFNELISSRETKLTINWHSRLHLQERELDDERDNTTVYYKAFDSEEVDYLSETKNITDEQLPFKLKWISFKQQFFNATLVAEEGFLSANVSSVAPEDSTYLKYLQAKMYLPYVAGNVNNYDMRFYFGPTGFNQLKKYDLEMEEMVPMGWAVFRWVNTIIILPVFNFFERFTDEYGLIILFLAIFIKVILTPLTYKSYLSQAKMKVLKPEMDELRDKFKDEPQKMQMETMKLYRKTGVSMMGGCLPTLLQMPILIAMYRFFPASIHLRQAELWWAEDLSTYDSILNLPFSVPFYGEHISLFTILMAATSFLYARMNSSMMSGPSAAQMKMMQYIMPFFLIFIFNSLPAGLTYYYLLYNVLSFVQQYAFQKFLIDEKKIRAKIEERKKKPVKVSKWQKKLEDLQKVQQQQQAQRSKTRRKK